MKPGDLMTPSKHCTAWAWPSPALWRNERDRKTRINPGTSVLVLAYLQPDDEEDVVMVVVDGILGYMYASVLDPAWT